MNHLMTKIKIQKKEKLFKLFSEQEAVFDIDTVNIILEHYDVDHNLDEEAWFKVERFSLQDYCLDFLKRDFVAAEYNDLVKANFKSIAFIFSVQGENVFFQKVFPSTYLSKKIIGFGDVAHLEKGKIRLCINQYPDAIYLRQSDTLIFRKLSTISSIFPGIDTLYKEATNEEVQEFLNADFLKLAGGFNLDKVSKPNRARIALAMNTLAEMDAKEKDQMCSYIYSYCNNTLKFDEDNDKFEIETDEQLKMLLYGIEERFYTTPLGQQKRLANSVKPM